MRELIDIIKSKKKKGFRINSSVWYLQKIIDYFEFKINPILDNKYECSAGYFQVIVDPDMSVRFCCMLPPIGNLRINKLKDIWISENAANQRKMIKEGKCPSCWLMYIDNNKEC